jgi:hypothetical protein
MNKVNIDRIAFIGRTYEEYMRLFDLNETILRQGPVLDCPAGAASFTAEASRSGIDATACDILYGSALENLIGKGRNDIEHIHDKVKEVPHMFMWNYYKDIDNLISQRERALEIFASDFKEGSDEGRYRYGKLPELPYPDKHFSLVLSSHFLFLYGDWLDLEFHIKCLKELTRVCCGEIRIYPLTGLDAKPYPYLDEVLSTLNENGYKADIVQIPFEFQKGSNRMMIIKCSNPPL